MAFKIPVFIGRLFLCPHCLLFYWCKYRI